jgi:hypothetical protein
MKRRRIGGCNCCGGRGGAENEFSSKVSTSGENIYYDATISNNSDAPIIASFIDDRDTVILEKPSDYTCAVIRFFVPASLIPLFYFPATPNYFVTTFRFNGLDFNLAVVYSNTEDTTNPPGLNAVHTYQHMLEMINANLFALYALCVAIPGAGLPANGEPRIYYNETNQLFYLRGRGDVYGPSPSDVAISPLGKIEIWFNYNLAHLFNTMRGLLQGFGRADFKDFQVFVQNNVHNVVAGPPNVYDMPTEVNTQYAWNQITKLLFQSGSAPSRAEFALGPPNDQGSNATNKIFFDFEPLVGGDERTSATYQFYPQGPYRILDLVGDTPMYNFDCRVLWADALGNTFPVMVPPRSQCTIKFIFEKK